VSERTWDLADEAATVALGSAIGQALKARPDAFTLFLEGELGAGKTTLCRGLLKAFGHSGAVKSPTYTLVEVYEFADRRIHHFDLYRLGDPEELEYMGIRDYFGPGHICVLEWPERGHGILPDADLRVKVTARGPGRRAQLSAGSGAGQSLINELPAGLPD
jgi:tRNA threonylcarbamoyladenosine biosynthesis protein TsaE